MTTYDQLVHFNAGVLRAGSLEGPARPSEGRFS